MSTVEVTDLSNPAAVTAVLDRLLAAAPQPQPRPSLSYLRCKPGRGLVAVYGTPRDPDHLYTVRVDERGLTVQSFPDDPTLPALAAAMEPGRHPALWSALQDCAAARLPGGPTWSLAEVEAEPVRYKPGDRCVIRYRLSLHRGDGVEKTTLSVIGKLYREPAQAEAAAALLGRLRATATRWCPAPLAVLDCLALMLSEDLGDQQADPPTTTGTRAIRPGSPDSMHLITAAAAALAELHTCDPSVAGAGIRRGTDEAMKVAIRARLLADHFGQRPDLVHRIARVSTDVRTRLAALEPDKYRPTHGSFKPSQLLARGDAAFVVDFDQFALADPALDIGYFLAYLRPAGLFYGRFGIRDWFEANAITFRRSYVTALTECGVPSGEALAILRRSSVYEAALLFKIAARRPNRLHSPRPREVQAMLSEIARCLAAFDRGSISGT